MALTGQCQIIMATHSPILTRHPFGELLSFKGTGELREFAFKAGEDWKLYGRFLSDPEKFPEAFTGMTAEMTAGNASACSLPAELSHRRRRSVAFILVHIKPQVVRPWSGFEKPTHRWAILFRLAVYPIFTQ